VLTELRPQTRNPDDRPKPDDFVPPFVTHVDLDAAGIRNVVWATGYGLDFSLDRAAELRRRGYPRHVAVTRRPVAWSVA